MPAVLPIATALAPVVGSGIGKLIGGKKKVESSVPDDLQGMRGQQIGLLNYLLGMGPDPRVAGGGAPAGPTTLPNGAKGWGMTPAQQALQGAWDAKHPGVNAAKYPGYQTPTAQNNGQMRLSEGGAVSGPGTGTSDSIPAMLSNGEGVLTAQTVQALGGPQIIDVLNHLGRQHFADGGVAGMPQTQMAPPRPEPVLGMPPVGGGNGLSAPAVQPMMDPMPQLPNPMGQQGAGNGGGMQTPQQRLESFFGPMGITPSGLQTQGGNALGTFLGQQSPEARAAGVAAPALQNTINGGSPDTQAAINRLYGMQAGVGSDVQNGLAGAGQGPSMGDSDLQAMLKQLGMGNMGSQIGKGGTYNPGAGVQADTGNEAVGLLRSIAGGKNPGQGVVDALNPLFERNLAAANQVGGRFGSGNAILRSRGVEDFNNTAAQALQRGVDQQTTAASQMGNLILGGNQLGAQTALGSRGQDVQAGIAGANNQYGANTTGLNAQLSALGLQQTGQQGLSRDMIQALSSLGGLQLGGQGQTAQNVNNSGQLGVANTGLGTQAAQVYGALAGQQGGAERANAMNAFNAGTTLTGQENYGQQNVQNILQQLLGTAQSATLGGPSMVTPSGAQQGADMGTGIAQLLAMLQKPKAAATGG